MRIILSIPGRNPVIQTLIPIIQVRAKGISLFCPEQICGFIVFEDQSEHFLYAFFLQSIFRERNQVSCNSYPPEVRMNAHVMNDSPPTVVTCQNHADDPAIQSRRKARVLVPLNPYLAFRCLS